MFQPHFTPFKGSAFRRQPQCFWASIRMLLTANKNALLFSIYTTFIILYIVLFHPLRVYLYFFILKGVYLQR